MALMAVLRSSSRSMASIFCFWMKKRRNNSDAKTATMMISMTVKPFLWSIGVLYHIWYFYALILGWAVVYNGEYGARFER